MRISGEEFLTCYRDWVANINLHLGHLLITEIRKTTNPDIKKALIIKLFYEYIQAGEHLLILIHAIKKSKSLAELKKNIVKAPSGGGAYRYLLRDLPHFKKNPYRFYNYLGVAISNEEYIKDKKAFDGLYNAVCTCLQNRYRYSRKDRVSKISRAFAKVKHGFPIYNDPNSNRVYIFLSRGKEIRRDPFTCSDNLAEAFYGSLQSLKNSLHNVAELAINTMH